MTHFISDKSLQRRGYVYEAASGGGYIGHPEETEFWMNWKHVDGPLLLTSNGRLHWLTWRERIQLFFGWTTLDRINWKYRNGH